METIAFASGFACLMNYSGKTQKIDMASYCQPVLDEFSKIRFYIKRGVNVQLK